VNDLRPAGITLHLTPADVWEAQRVTGSYVPEAFAEDGFIHCTNGAEALLVPANAHYRSDPRPFVVLEVDIDRVQAPVRYDDDAGRYPHIYGALNVDAVGRQRRVERAPDGTFLAFPTS